MKFQDARILIGVLDYPFIESECVMSILGMWEYSKWKCPGEHYPRNDVELFLSNGTSPARAHNTAISVFLNHSNRYMYLLIVGHDHIFHPDALRVLFEADKDIVAGISTIRLKSFEDIKTPVFSIVSDWKDGRVVTLTKQDCMKKIENEKGQPFKVPGIGDGLMLVKRKVFERMEPPWFQEPPLPEEEMVAGRFRGLLGCDIAFCRQARELGFELWAHPGVPYIHIGRSYTSVNYPI